MKKSGTITTDSFKHAAKATVGFINRYRIFMFFLLVSALYGFIVWRINVLVVAGPTQAEVQTAQQETTVPRINQTIIDKILSLKDNSVRVQTLFEDARNNPFSE